MSAAFSSTIVERGRSGSPRVLPWLGGLWVWVCLAGFAYAQESAQGRVSKELAEAVVDYLRCEAAEEPAAMAKVVELSGGDIATVAQALRTHPPLTQAGPAVYHGLTFSSGGREWEYSIRLPSGYDGSTPFAVLLLPDHALVDPEAGIDFWTQHPDADHYILFRPVILKYKEDKSRFPDQQFFAVDQAIAAVMKEPSGIFG